MDGGGHAAATGAEPPFADTYLSYLLSRAAHQISTEFHQVVTEAGLRVPVWRVLACLWDRDGMGVSDLADRTIFEQSRLTKMLDGMEADGLVRRVQEPSDRRRVRLHITDKGRALIAPLVARAREHEARVLADYSAEEIAALQSALNKLAGARGKPTTTASGQPVNDPL